MKVVNKGSIPYRALCSEYYELDKPDVPKDAFECYLRYIKEANGPILEPMCGTGRFLIPLLEKGYSVTGFDSSPYMLEVCRGKLRERHLSGIVHEASFETFSLPQMYNLIFIPSGSFCLLTTNEQTTRALSFISQHLQPRGKLVFEIETLTAVSDSQNVWKGDWVQRDDGSKIVLSTLSRFDELSRIETVLCRYELWEENAISCIEVEDFCLRRYVPSEIEQLLAQHGLQVIGKWQTEISFGKEISDNSSAILYECINSRPSLRP